MSGLKEIGHVRWGPTWNLKGGTTSLEITAQESCLLKLNEPTQMTRSSFDAFAPAAHPSRAAACHRVTNKFFSFFLDMSNFPQVTESWLLKLNETAKMTRSSFGAFAPVAHPSWTAACHRVTTKFLSFFPTWDVSTRQTRSRVGTRVVPNPKVVPILSRVAMSQFNLAGQNRVVKGAKNETKKPSKKKSS